MWSPDGRKILLLRSGWENAGVEGDVYVMNADGSGQRNLTRSLTHHLRMRASDRLSDRFGVGGPLPIRGW